METREKNLQKKRKKIRSEKESATESNPSLSFSAIGPPIPHRTHALFNRSPPRPRFFLPRPSFDPAPPYVVFARPQSSNLSPFYLASTAWSAQENNGVCFRCVVRCRAVGGAVFVRSWEFSASLLHFLRTPLGGLRCSRWVAVYLLIRKPRLLVWEGPPFQGEEFGAG